MDKVDEFKAAVAAGRKLRYLIFELSLANANEILDVYHALEHLKPFMAGLGIKEK